MNAAFASWQPSSLSTTNFSNFDNLSYDKNCYCLFFPYENTQNFYSCNFINNKVLFYHMGIFWLKHVILSVKQSFFKGNQAYYLFMVDDESDSPTYYAYECHFESDNTFTKTGSFIRNSKKMTKINLSIIYSSFICEHPFRNKKDSIIIPSIPISNLISDKPYIPPK